MAQAEFHEVLPVDQDQLFATILRYEDYPKFVEGCSKVKVERPAPNQARVTYYINMMKDIVYTLDHSEDPANGRMTWKLVEGDALKTNSGSWELKAAGAGRTDVRYSVEVDFKIPVPGFILNRLVKSNLPSMVKGFAEQAKRSAGKA